MRRRRLARIGLYLGAGAFLAFTLFPVYWAAVSSLESGAALFTIDYWPRDPAWENYSDVFADQPFGRNIANSVIVATLTVGLSLALAAGAGFALGRVSFRGRRLMLAVVLATTMFPQVAVLAGMFELIRGLGLYNNLAGLALSYLLFTLPFTVWVVTTFMRQVPAEIEAAALIDGAPPWRVVWSILLPLVRPGLVTAGLLAFIGAWNEFLFALTFTLTDAARTVPVAIALISGASQYELPWGRIMAASVIVTLPIVALAAVFQRRIATGLAAGAIKG
ncbi:MAG: carbohydrate ABC transporter permease [Alphaproteobacteria bacterium]|jgi:trehalose/maltose transport system permease protein|nr:carbohydrate ABC transporter permease [Alphaproteobacteria bacterium]MDP6516660.1 carbohydrate ABC transporter permease [Alphaproteobacteria bacterium]